MEAYCYYSSIFENLLVWLFATAVVFLVTGFILFILYVFFEEIKEFGICVVFILIWHLLLKKDSPSFSSSSTNHISSNQPNRIFDVTHRSHRDHYHLPDQFNSSKSVYRGILPVFSVCVPVYIFIAYLRKY